MISAEGDLLACTARSTTDRRSSERVDGLITRGIDWDRFLWAANSHGLTLLADQHLSELPSVPAAIRTRLRKRARQIAERNIAMVALLLRLDSVLTSEGLVGVPFKGPTLALSAYGNLASRQFVDLDIAVRKREVRRARAVLAREGFSGGPRSRQEEAALMRYTNEFTLGRPKDGMIVELQWAAAPRYFAIPVAMESFWSSLGSVDVGGKLLHAFADEDLLFLLLVHGAKHLWERLIWVCDVAELVRSRPNLDWDRVSGHAYDVRAVRVLAVGLGLAHRLQPDVPLPPDVIRTIRDDPEGEKLAESLWSRTLCSASGEEDQPFRWLDLRMREDRRDRATYCWRLASTPTRGDWEWLSLPRSMRWAYLPLRPVRLGWKYGKRALSRGSRIARGD
jgi:hypothetical protein